MSDFENYSRTSRSYDATRSAVGTPIILGCLAASRPLHETAVLDAGCGTANYAAAVLPHVAQLVGVDLNAGMLAVARDKLADGIAEGRVRLERGDLAALPLDDASVDAIMVNHVLHHLPDRAPGPWRGRARVLGEFARVLRPGGTLVINACMPVQIRHGWWFFALIPEAVERVCQRHPDFSAYCDLLEAGRFRVHGRTVPVDALLQGEHYFDTHGPERQAWRDGDSTWAAATPEELERALARLADLHRRGAAEAFRREHDLRREEIGQNTFIHATLEGT